ncbi:putative glycoside hydrolase [Bacillus sp. FJAT-49711]|uniref:putative glycoside hydrolase n=1 Tax=Bacillus sp. FJAT-49711 TaxID=2833585 RepID=UPI001BCA0DDF|nr:putative glycoside hydrolase [Bacillus sp. FJAT-49711]MBS4218012.1 putative glycoside hydrolase [Bacillus sp. FJAT-49711]
MMTVAGLAASLLWQLPSSAAFADDLEKVHPHIARQLSVEKKTLQDILPRFTFNSGRHFEYPDAVRGIYVTGHSAGGSKFNDLVKLIDSTDLNAMVIDVKDDWGQITYKLPKDSPFAHLGQNYIHDPKEMLDVLEEKQIYPIARIVVFKDSTLPKTRPDLSFKDGKKIWVNGRGESFVNPFLKEVWDYNVDIAIEAAKLGFQEIQFDYVRFPEGFENRDTQLKYGLGHYKDSKEDNVQKRVHAVTDFVAYAKEKLAQYGVKVSVDIFGYTATLPEAPGIGQNFSKISENVDVISSMIYPSHWTSYFGITKPDLEPYKLVREYAKLENAKLKELKSPPVSRPWLQDFTASYLGAGNYQVYGKEQVEAQIKALYDEGIDEYLLWNAGNKYSPNVDYTPEKK